MTPQEALAQALMFMPGNAVTSIPTLSLYDQAAAILAALPEGWVLQYDRFFAAAIRVGAQQERERLLSRVARPDEVVAVIDSNGNKWWEPLSALLSDPEPQP